MPLVSVWSLNLQVGVSNLDGFQHSAFTARLGGAYEANLTNRWSIAPEVGIFLPGNRVVITDNDPTTELTREVSHTRFISGDLQIPLVFRPYTKLALVAGPYCAYRFYVGRSLQTEFVTSNGAGQNQFSFDDTFLYEQLDWGIRIGIEYQIFDAIAATLTFGQGLRQLSVLNNFGVSQRMQTLMLGIRWHL